MSTEVPYENEEEFERALHKMCKCGHELYIHGNTMGSNYFTGGNVLVVSICAFCGSEKCPRFEAVTDDA